MTKSRAIRFHSLKGQKLKTKGSTCESCGNYEGYNLVRSVSGWKYVCIICKNKVKS